VVDFGLLHRDRGQLIQSSVMMSGVASLDDEKHQISRPGTTGGLVSFVWVLLALALSIGAWSLSTPLGAAPDEPSHVTEAAAVVRGQLDNPEMVLRIGSTPVGEVGWVGVPRWVTQVSVRCFRGKPNVPASCAPVVGNDTKPVVTATQFARYPPLYYLIAGVPSLLATGSGALYGMRLTVVLLDAALIALGLFLLAHYHPRRLSLVGAMIALSPMVFFVTSVVNSSGMETAAAFAAWCGGLCLVERTSIPNGLAVLTAVSFAILILSRPISPANAAVIIAVLMTLAVWGRARAFLRNRSVRPVWISILIAMILFGVFVIAVGAPAPLRVGGTAPMGLLDRLWLTLRLTGGRLRQCIGDFGWLDTPAPRWIVVVWTLVLVGFLAYGLAVSPRCRRALPLLALAIVAMPMIFESPQMNSVGPYWQGRYWLPLVVGLPLVASSVAPRRVPPTERPAAATRRQLGGVVSLGLLVIVAQVAAFLTALHRYETGLGVPAGSRARWTPPGGTVLVVSIFIIGQILFLGFVAWTDHDKVRTQELTARNERSNVPRVKPPPMNSDPSRSTT
jgi:hypothetical protein